MRKKQTYQSGVSNLKILKDFSSLLFQVSDPQTTMQAILELIMENVKSMFLIYLILDASKQELVLGSFADHGTQFPLVRNLIQFDLYKIKYPLKRKEPLVCKCINENRIMKSDHLRDFFYPVFKRPLVLDAIQKMLNIRHCASFPIRMNEKATGVIFCASNKEKLSDEEMGTMELYANMAGVAMNNSIQFELLEKHYEMEKTTTSILSHELRTPISITFNSAELIAMTIEKAKKELPSRTYQSLSSSAEDVRNSTARMARICNSIFALREVESNIPLDIHELDINRQLEGILAHFERKAKAKGLAFKTSVDDVPFHCYGAIVQLEQVITILLDNAVKYTDEGSVGIEVKVKGEKINVKVFDTGKGISAKEKKKIFGKFYRSTEKNRKETEGLGLGLYICKKIIDKLEGKIRITDNKQEKGTEFNVSIPVFKKARAQHLR